MPQTPHIERHFTSSEAVRDIVIGMADGLTVPFALAAGLSGAVGTTRVIVVAGLAEIAAGSIAMGLGGYLAAKSDAEHYVQEREREWREVRQIPQEEAREVAEILETYGMEAQEAHTVVAALEKRPEAWVDFMMRFELGLEPPEPGRAVRSAATIAGSYVAGGLIPLSPYMIVSHAFTALIASICVTLAALAIFGYIKGRFTGARPIRSASQTLVTGALAAAAAYALAKLIS
jgi:VIT1/CCC1 family predicted Fe2+/Mn2+ transporter